MRRVILGLVLIAAFVLNATGALAAGAVSYTQTDHNVTEVMPGTNQCTDAPGTLTITYNDVFHITMLDDGTFHRTFTQTGTFSFAPTDTSQPSYTGHITIWDGDNDTLHNGTETVTFNVHARGSDGSLLSFHAMEHLSVSATGVTVSFDKIACSTQ